MPKKSVFQRSSFSSRKKGGSGRRVSSILPIVSGEDFKYGLMNYDPAQKIPRGAASDELNFLTRGKKIETRNGYAPVGTEIAGNGRSAGVFTAHKYDGTEVLVRARVPKLEYFNDTTGLWVEIGTNILLGAAATEIISFAEYTGPSGAQLWVSSPNSDLLKIMTANMSAVSQYDASKNFKGNIEIKQNRMFLWGYLGNTLGKSSNAALRLSYIDAQAYSTVTSENIGTGDGSTKQFNNTLASVSGKVTAFGIVATDMHETFTDNYDGTLTGSLGGTGLINYATGVIQLNFFSAPANSQAITVNYSTEDSSNTGIADFTFSGTRLAGQGAVFNQSDGGKLLNVFSLSGAEYCLHERKAWILTLNTDDTTATNLIYRDRLALASQLGGVATSDGIYYVDTTIKSRPYVAVLSYDPVSSLVLPKDLSSNILDLSGYSFDQCVASQWDKYILFACRTTDSSVNNRILMLNKDLGTFDIVDFYANGFCIKAGTLMAGDSATVNVYNLFSGFDDNGAAPNYYWTGNIDDLGISGLKKTKELWLEGEIDLQQNSDVYLAIDRGGFVKVGTISGSGNYVDKGQAVLVGSLIVGLEVVGGGSNGATAFHYECRLKISGSVDRFQYAQIKFVPTGIGYFSSTMYMHEDVRTKKDKLPLKYRS